MKANAWKYIVSGIVFIVAAGIVVLFLPLKTVPYEVTETYYETEMRQEPYTATEQYEIKTPHSTILFQAEDEYCAPHFLFLFNEDNDGTIRWSNGISKFPRVKTFKPESEGRNHRISVAASLTSLSVPDYASGQPVVIGLMGGREPAAIKLGFKPNEAASEEVVLMTIKEVSGVPWTPYGLIISSPCESSGLRGTLRCIQKTTEYERSSLLVMYPEEQELIEKLNVVMTGLVKNVMADLLEAGYYGSHSQVVKEERLGSLAHPIEFSFDEMFQTDGWALICITSLPFTIHCSLTMSIDYMWDDVEIGTREVAKYREVQVQVEKQRTVTEYEKISLWGSLFR